MSTHEEIINKPSVWFNEDSNLWVYRASALGQCFEALVFAKLEYDAEDFPQWLQDRMADSAGLEDEALYQYIVEEVESKHPNRAYSIEQQVECILPLTTIPDEEFEDDVNRYVILGHCDATVRIMTIPQPTQRLIEIKSLGEVMFNKCAQGRDYLPETYKWQISCYMHAQYLPLDLYIFPKMGDGNPNLGVDPLIYSFNDPKDIPITLEKIRERILGIEAAAESGVPPECPGKQFPCAYFKHHIKPEKDTLVIAENDLEESDDYIRELISEFADAKQEEDKLKKQLALVAQDRKNLQAELFEFMKENGDPKVIRASGIEVEKIRSHNSYPDWERLEAEFEIRKEDYERKVFYSYPRMRIL